ncbi:MAG: hypothetical protein HWD90_02235 [Campylobacteraceae bacterium]|nr:hypothetical protein [Campylobacteraceae bacterium]
MLKSLNVAQSGLYASKVAIENISNNLANENTPGYKKRVVQLSELELIDSRFTGRGVKADAAYRITSQYMYDNLMNENTKTNYYDRISSITGNIEVMFEETDESGFSNDLDRFFQSVENLRTNPNSEIYRTTLKTQGSVLVESLQNLYKNIEKEEALTKLSLEANVQKVNGLINEIGDVNQQLGQHIEASNDLLDKRDQLERELSKYVDIEVDRSNNEYTLKVGGEIAVRYNTNIREINLVEEFEPQIDRFSTNPPKGKAGDAIAENYDIGPGDKISYKFNNEFEVSVELGSNTYKDVDGNEYEIDFDQDGVADTVDETNYIRALSFAINSNKDISAQVTAYNGDYSIDEQGNIVDNIGEDEFLRIEANVAGEEGKFQGRIVVEEGYNPTFEAENVISPNDVVDSDLSIEVDKKEYIYIDGQQFSTVGETFVNLAAEINAVPAFNPTTYDPGLEELNINGTIFSTTNKTYDDLIADINADGTYSAIEGKSITLNGVEFVTEGEDFAALASQIDTSTLFNASFDPVLEELTINGEIFSTSGPATYRDVANSINASSNFSSFTEERGTITINAGTADKTFTITDTTTYQDLVDEINLDPELNALVSADGKLVISNLNDMNEPVVITEDLPTPLNFTEVEKNIGSIFKNEQQSVDAEDKVYLAVYDKEIKLKSGIVKAELENLTTKSPNNKIIDYKEKLDDFARSLSDIYDKFVKTDVDGDYVYGHVATDSYNGDREVKNLNLFTGMDVMSLKFKEDSVNDLNQVDLDYMATMQWKKDVEFDGFAQDGSSLNNTSFAEYFQEIRVNISSDKENNDFLLETQETVFQSLQFKFEQLTKVDPDEEMINLMQYQAAYTANAKIITAVDEMIQTLLGM